MRDIVMILCCGEALIDFLPRKGADGADVYQPFNGGSIYNTAIALGRLGVPVSYFGGLSTDFFGDSLVQGLKESLVDIQPAKIQARDTTMAFVKLTDGQARYSFIDAASAGRMLTKKDLPKLSKSCAALHFGSISLIPEPCGGTYEALLKRESKTRVISLDPNIRPTLIAKKRDHLARLNRLIALCDILKISDEDVAWMTGHHDLAKAAKVWLKKGPKIVAITKGGDGVEIYTKAFSFMQTAPKVVVADTVGAGDTFTAGLLATLFKDGNLTKKKLAAISENDLRHAVDFAARAAAVTCTRPGANPPWAKEIK
jgi:fructokinase